MADEFESKAFLQGSSGSSEESLNSFLDEQVTDDGDSTSCSIPQTPMPESKNESEVDEEPEKQPIFRPTFRTKRRLSVAPLPALRLNDKEMIANEFDSQSVISNQASIASATSITSLLKEKMQAFPQALRRKRKETKDYKIKVFVVILLLIIVFLVGYAHIMYHNKVLTRSYFDKIKFNNAKRLLTVYNDKGDKILTGNLGTTVMADKPFHCLSDDIVNDGSVCLEWTDIARMYMNYENLDIYRCYSIKWQALGEGIYPTDCYDISFKDGGYWYGGGLTKNANWPLNSADFDFTPFITGDANVQEFGNALRRYFISSRGVAIQIDDRSPLQLSINKTSNKFCMRAKNDNFAFVNKLTELPELSYKICVANNMNVLHRQMTKQSLWDGIKAEDKNILNTMLKEPVWQIPALNHTFLNENTIYNYSEEVIGMGFMKLGHILVNEFWQENIGDFSVDKERFPTLKNTVDVLHRRGFRIIFTVQPFISTDSINFKDAVKKKLLIYERLSERSIPALTRYKSSTSAGVLDVTNRDSIPWLVKKLEKVIKEYQIDGFYFDLGTAYNLPHYYQCRETLDNPDMYARKFMIGLEELIANIGISSATRVPRPPAFLSLPPASSSWSGLKNLVVSVLTHGILGFPFILPGSVGGDYVLPENATKMVSFYSLPQPPLSSEELYIRWVQLVSFFPSRQFSHLPSEFKNEEVMEMVKDLTKIHQETVVPVLERFLTDAMNEGLPLIRPLWMLDSQDPACLSVSDEFSVGEDIIVAPILEQGQLAREVYLPQGVWRDGIDGSMRKGSRWIHNYRVALNKVAYFERMPNNTRF
ncbi:myogenesis-regulating glycosidase isoform X2 [Hermetia illucens]|uniref:myogenesis-regulating glycosidase isoform X2 n=1 Tax=Hermetia illucens TaxID=343691 RepID=UPI0018CC4EFF|nr:myogenesis-regulating glycosidase isoform X2 [Hermetia illucens]